MNRKALEYLSAQPWAIRPEMMEVGRDIVLREHASEPESVQTRRGQRVESTSGTTIRDGVAIIPITGPIFRYADWFVEMCGGATTESLAMDLRTAVENSGVRAVLLEIDSPGGEAKGIAELAAQIRAATATKPIVAYIGGDGCSAAYWLASAASEIVMAPTATAGSIGTVMGYPRKRDDPRSVEFVSSQSPDKRPDIDTDQGRAVIQRTVDDLTTVFVAAVAEYRGATVETVLSNFGRGGYMVGARAVAAGLADRIGSFEAVLAELASGATPKPRPAPAPSKPARPGPRPLFTGKPMSKFLSRLIKGAVAQTPDDEDIDLEAIAAVASAGTAPRLSAALAVAEPLKTAKVDVTQSDEYKALSARLEKAEAAAKGIDASNADAFAANAVKASKILPAGAEDAKSLHLQLAADDRANPLASGSRVETLGRLVQSLPGHSLTKEQASAETLPAGSRTLPADGAGGGTEAGISPERRAFLMGLTSLGEAAAEAAR